MSSPFQNPALRYGLPLMSALLVAGVALTVLEGTTRWVALGIAGLELVAGPQILKRAQ